jgi:hypothetical protein
MRWKLIPGEWRWPYRVNDQGVVQRQHPDGAWKTLKPYPYQNQYRVEMHQPDNTIKRVQVAKLVVDAFMGGTPPGMVRFHKNGLKQDNAVENIIFLTQSKAAKMQRPGNSRPVLKLDRAGEVVDMYPSISAAARANHISYAAMGKRCLGLIQDPYRLDGYNYVFEDAGNGKRGRPKRRRYI